MTNHAPIRLTPLGKALAGFGAGFGLAMLCALAEGLGSLLAS